MITTLNPRRPTC